MDLFNKNTLSKHSSQIYLFDVNNQYAKDQYSQGNTKCDVGLDDFLLIGR